MTKLTVQDLSDVLRYLENGPGLPDALAFNPQDWGELGQSLDTFKPMRVYVDDTLERGSLRALLNAKEAS